MVTQNFEILEVASESERAQIVTDVLADLPEWFSLPESTSGYIEAAVSYVSGQLMINSNQSLLSASAQLARTPAKFIVWASKKLTTAWDWAVAYKPLWKLPLNSIIVFYKSKRSTRGITISMIKQ